MKKRSPNLGFAFFVYPKLITHQRITQHSFMCGRYSFVPSKKQLEKELADVELPEQLEISFNIAPTQAAYVITNNVPKRLQLMRWGLAPAWMKEAKPNFKMINARAETVAEKPSFRAAFKERRCIVPADSFYEWRTEGKTKHPYRIQNKDESLLFFAGLWEMNTKGETPLLTFTILTSSPNAEMAKVHSRMPVIFQEKTLREQWLSETTDETALKEMVLPLKDGTLKMYEVNNAVGNVRNNGPGLHLAL